MIYAITNGLFTLVQIILFQLKPVQKLFKLHVPVKSSIAVKPDEGMLAKRPLGLMESVEAIKKFKRK